MLHCPLPSRPSCLSEERPGHRASPNPLARAGSQCLIPHAGRDTSNLRGCEMLGKINVGCGFINSLFFLSENCWPFMISQNTNPESSTAGKFGACWHLFYGEQELTEFQPPEFLGRGIVCRAFSSVFLIPIAHQITQQQNRNQLQKGHSYLEFTTTKELYLIFSLPCRKKLNFLQYSTMSH